MIRYFHITIIINKHDESTHRRHREYLDNMNCFYYIREHMNLYKDES
jgi:hypothetical protein